MYYGGFIVENPVNHWSIPDKNRTPPRKAIRLSAVVSFDTDNIQGNLFGCLPWARGVRFLSGIYGGPAGRALRQLRHALLEVCTAH